MMVIADALFLMLRLVPDVPRLNIAVKYSSDSTRLSEFTFTAVHISAPSAEPERNDRDVIDRGV
jgi:hypothetical protein